MNWYDKTDNIPVKIQQQLALVNKLQDEIGERQLIIDAMEKSMHDMVNSWIGLFNAKMLNTAFQQQHGKKKSERPMFETVREIIAEHFFPSFDLKEIKITQITCGGWENYYYGFDITVGGCKFDLRIPAPGNIPRERMDVVNYGQYALYDANVDHVLNRIKCAYYPEPIAKAIEEFIKEWEKKNEDQENH
jgi:hypothetical protein